MNNTKLKISEILIDSVEESSKRKFTFSYDIKNEKILILDNDNFFNLKQINLNDIKRIKNSLTTIENFLLNSDIHNEKIEKIFSDKNKTTLIGELNHSKKTDNFIKFVNSEPKIKHKKEKTILNEENILDEENISNEENTYNIEGIKDIDIEQNTKKIDKRKKSLFTNFCSVCGDKFVLRERIKMFVCDKCKKQ
ncbi:hypothetical protein M0Q97_02260 [Candidatus Dojkabacteria bacterium]|jgi:hypothetical protein|nr:hypothetical protein [Candidatus Dojkabacteria bacterium]